MKILVSVPDKLVETMDAFVDGKNFRNRSQLISVVLADWIARERHPMVEFGGDAYAQAISECMFQTNTPIVNQARNETRRELLGDDWDKFQHANALVFEEDETGEVNRQVRVLERKHEALEERLAALESKLLNQQVEPATQPEEPRSGKTAKPKRKATKP